jgi:hypothetical protein
MQQYRASSLWFALSPLVLSGFPATSGPLSGPPPATARGTPIPTRTPAPAGFPPLPLQGPLTLDSGKKPGIVPPKVDYYALKEDLGHLGSNTLNNYKAQLALMYNHVRDCRNHKYTVEEQQKAGCKGTDTLDQCKEKLVPHCMNTSSFSLKHYKEATQKFLDETPKLIELLKKAQARVKYEAFYYDFD